MLFFLALIAAIERWLVRGAGVYLFLLYFVKLMRNHSSSEKLQEELVNDAVTIPQIYLGKKKTVTPIRLLLPHLLPT
jgi:hypothetical protein